MRDPKRIPVILDRLKEAWELAPDLRLPQLIMAVEGTGRDLFYIEDEELLTKFDEFIKQRK
jgi:hypothetical protein